MIVIQRINIFGSFEVPYLSQITSQSWHMLWLSLIVWARVKISWWSVAESEDPESEDLDMDAARRSSMLALLVFEDSLPTPESALSISTQPDFPIPHVVVGLIVDAS